jgi:hypothetical protein
LKAEGVASVNPTPHTIVFVNMDRTPMKAIRWDQTQKRFVAVDTATLHQDGDTGK